MPFSIENMYARFTSKARDAAIPKRHAKSNSNSKIPTYHGSQKIFRTQEALPGAKREGQAIAVDRRHTYLGIEAGCYDLLEGHERRTPLKLHIYECIWSRGLAVTRAKAQLLGGVGLQYQHQHQQSSRNTSSTSSTSSGSLARKAKFQAGEKAKDGLRSSGTR